MGGRESELYCPQGICMIYQRALDHTRSLMNYVNIKSTEYIRILQFLLNLSPPFPQNYTLCQSQLPVCKIHQRSDSLLHHPEQNGHSVPL